MRRAALGVVHGVNSGYSRALRSCICCDACSFRARIQLDVWAVHTLGVQNGITDAISQNNLHRFFLQVPEARARRVMVPGTEGAANRAAVGLDVGSLGPVVWRLFSVGLAPATRQNYRSGTRRYLSSARCNE